MNPAKISKMDDEVAKWSRKDPYAIKKAMICPGRWKLIRLLFMYYDFMFGLATFIFSFDINVCLSVAYVRIIFDKRLAIWYKNRINKTLFLSFYY